MHIPTLCDWLSSSTSAFDSDNLVSLDHKQNASNGVVSGIGTLFSLDYELYTSDYDSGSYSDSVTSENQP